MKKYLIIILCTFILLFSAFTTVKTDTYAKVDNTNEVEIVENKTESNTVENTQTEDVVEQEESSKYVQTSTEEEYEDTVDYSYEDNTYYEQYGTYGRLYIYSYSAALYDYNVYTNSSYSLQSIVDDADSAAFYRNKGKLVIADHNYQGFSILGYLEEGDTASIRFEDGSSIEYRLIRVSKGYNTGPDLVDTEGNSFFYMDSDIIMYTCYDDGIMASLWVQA